MTETAVEGDDKLKSDKQISKTQNMQKRHALSTIKVKKKLVKTKKKKRAAMKICLANQDGK